jgi:hypothetical protein
MNEEELAQALEAAIAAGLVDVEPLDMTGSFLGIQFLHPENKADSTVWHTVESCDEEDEEDDRPIIVLVATQWETGRKVRITIEEGIE